MPIIPRNLLNEFSGSAQEAITESNTSVDAVEQLITAFTALTLEDVKVPVIASSLGKRKWGDTDMSVDELHQSYFEEDVQTHPAFIDYVHRYIHVIPTVELEDEEDTRMDVVEDEEPYEYQETRKDEDYCLAQPIELEDGEIFEPKPGSCYVVVDDFP